jgi:outer membrane protein assembly factor BamD (BamD/ComL family)
MLTRTLSRLYNNKAKYVWSFIEGDAMSQTKGNPAKPKTVIYVIAAIIIVLLIAVVVKLTGAEGTNTIWAAIGVILGIIAVVSLLTIVASTLKMIDVIDSSTAQIERLSDELTGMKEVLNEINQGTHLTETTKAIAFREAERRSLQDIVFDKLQQKQFDTAYEIIDEIAHRTGYRKLAEELRAQADQYRDASDTERINQMITHVEKLMDASQWAQANAHIEKLLLDYPKSERIQKLRHDLLDRKAERKKALLKAWDEAVRRQATDRSLEILKELDQYLTPNEGLALQEAARDVFRTKLHNLGVQFSLAVSGRKWADALNTAKEIVRDFPNSRMAEEIREKIAILEQNATQVKT